MGFYEKDAGKKWCPFVRLSTFESDTPHAEAAINRVKDVTGIGTRDVATFINNRCVGSKCACWEWEDGEGNFGGCGLSARRQS